MRREVPHRIDVRADPTEVQPLAVDVAHLTQFACVDQPFHVPHGGVIDERVARHDNEPAALGNAGQRVHFGDGRREWLLDEDMLAAFEGLLGEREMRGRGGGDDHADDVRVLERGVAGLHRGRPGEVALDECATLRAGVHDVPDLAVRKGGEVPEEVRPPVATPELGDDERSHRAKPEAQS